MLEVCVPTGFVAERRYIVSVLLGEFLGLPFQLRQSDGSTTTIRYGGSELEVADVFFAMDEKEWLAPDTLPELPLVEWNVASAPVRPKLVESRVPMVFARAAECAAVCYGWRGYLRLQLDVFGSCFFLLSRYEEAVLAAVDAHGRFEPEASVAWKSGFLDRPLVNEYVEILWACMLRLWPGLSRKRRTFRIVSTHDVDRPFQWATRRALTVLRHCLVEALKNGRPRSAVRQANEYLKTRVAGVKADPYNTFDWIMSECEKVGHRATFYFLTGDGHDDRDGDYRLSDHIIQELLVGIDDRGHRIGLHGSYRSYLDTRQIVREMCSLRRSCRELGIKQPIMSSRQHYLRLRTPDTYRCLEEAGIETDSTLAFASVAGFRAGVCYDYPVYDVVARRMVKLREHPLILMDKTVTSGRYMDLGSGEAAAQEINRLKGRCAQFGGDFVMLWHNSSLRSPEERALFRRAIQE